MNGNEYTFVSAISCVAVARMMVAKHSTINPKDCYKAMNSLKALVRLDGKRVKLPHHGQIQKFPGSPQELKELHPQVYELMYQGADDKPELGPWTGEPPLDTNVLAIVKAKLPARKTHSSINLNLQVASSIVGGKRPYSMLEAPPPMAVRVGRSMLAIEDGDVQEMSSTTSLRANEKSISRARTQVCLAQAAADLAEAQARESAARESLPSSTSSASSPGTASTTSPLSAKPSFDEISAKANLQTSSAKPTAEEIAAKAKLQELTPGATDSKDNDTVLQDLTTLRKKPASKITQAAGGPKGNESKKGGPKGNKNKKNAETQAKLPTPKELLPFPGVPKGPCPPMAYKDKVVYTDFKQSKWRVKTLGEKKDTASSWKVDAKKGWEKVNVVLAAK